MFRSKRTEDLERTVQTQQRQIIELQDKVNEILRGQDMLLQGQVNLKQELDEGLQKKEQYFG